MPPDPKADFEPALPPGVEAENVEYGVLFSNTYPPPLADSYNNINLPYDIGTKSEILLEADVMQRIFDWDGSTVVVARTWDLSDGFLYRFINPSGLTEVCKFALRR